MLTIDGSLGEGGGQCVRTSLALSLVTGTPVTLTNIRAGRTRPGLMRQHLTAARAAAKVGGAALEGDHIGSETLIFRPKQGQLKGGDHTFAVGTAGSAVLVFQTILPALLMAEGPSELTLQGGTHNSGSPTFDFLEQVFLPHLRAMGARVEVELIRHGFYPAGGGEFRAKVFPVDGGLKPIAILERGALRSRQIRAIIAHLPGAIAQRELDSTLAGLGWPKEEARFHQVKDSHGPGNLVSIELSYEHVNEVCVGFGAKGVKAEQVAEEVIASTNAWLESTAPVGAYLADQLLIPMAMAGGGRFMTLPLTEHTRTNIETVKQFIDLPIASMERGEREVEVRIAGFQG